MIVGALQINVDVTVEHLCSCGCGSYSASPLSKMVKPLLSSFTTRPTPINAVRTSVKATEVK